MPNSKDERKGMAMHDAWESEDVYRDARKAEIEKAILEYLENRETQFCNLIEYLISASVIRPRPSLGHISEALFALYMRGAVEIVGFCINRFSPRDLDVRIRRHGDFRHAPIGGGPC